MKKVISPRCTTTFSTAPSSPASRVRSARALATSSIHPPYGGSVAPGSSTVRVRPPYPEVSPLPLDPEHALPLADLLECPESSEGTFSGIVEVASTSVPARGVGRAAASVVVRHLIRPFISDGRAAR